MDKIFSIITPSFNQGEFIEETIQSVIYQEGDFFIDYIIMDGGSIDTTVGIIERFSKLILNGEVSKKLKNVEFRKFEGCKNLGVAFRWQSKKDDGHTYAINEGFKNSVGNYMAWINSDDKYHEGAFKTVSEVFSSFSNINWLAGKFSWWDVNGNEIASESIFKTKYDYLIGNVQWIQQESVFWTRKLWQKTGAELNLNYKHMMDTELWSRFFSLDKLYFVDKKLSGYRVHRNNRAKVKEAEVLDEVKKIITYMQQKASFFDKMLSIILKIIKKFRININLPVFNYNLIKFDSNLNKYSNVKIPYDVFDKINTAQENLYKLISTHK